MAVAEASHSRKAHAPKTPAAEAGMAATESKRPNYIVIFQKPSERNASILSKVLKVREARGVTSTAGTTLFVARSHARNPRSFAPGSRRFVAEADSVVPFLPLLYPARRRADLGRRFLRGPGLQGAFHRHEDRIAKAALTDRIQILPADLERRHHVRIPLASGPVA
jgi:hypothetical protein